FDRLASLLSRLESTPHPFAIDALDLARDPEKEHELRGKARLTATGVDVADVANEAQAERLLQAIERRVLARPVFAAFISRAIELCKNVSIDAVRIPEKGRPLVLEVRAAGPAFADAYASALGSDPTLAAAFAKPALAVADK